MRSIGTGTGHASRNSKGPTAPALLAGLICAGIAAIAIAVDALTLAPGASLTREGGAVELMSGLLYIAALAVFLRRAGEWRRWLWPVGALLAAMALREFDADKRFTSEGLLSVKILTHDTSLPEKAAGLLVMLALATALVLLVARTGRPFVTGLLRRSNWAVLIAAALALLVFTKSIDGLARKLEPFGIAVGAETSSLAGSVEEYLELGIPILLLMAVIARFPGREGRSR